MKNVSTNVNKDDWSEKLQLEAEWLCGWPRKSSVQLRGSQNSDKHKLNHLKCCLFISTDCRNTLTEPRMSDFQQTEMRWLRPGGLWNIHFCVPILHPAQGLKAMSQPRHPVRGVSFWGLFPRGCWITLVVSGCQGSV